MLSKCARFGTYTPTPPLGASNGITACTQSQHDCAQQHTRTPHGREKLKRGKEKIVPREQKREN